MPICSTLSKAAVRRTAFAALASSSLLASSALAQVAPALQHSAINLGRQQPSTPISATVWLQLHNKAELDAAVEAMYKPGSPTFQKFAGPEALKQFAPTAEELATVKKELLARNLRVVSTDSNNLSLKIAGQTSDFEAAFHTTVSQYRTRAGVTVSALASVPSLGNEAAGLVKAVTGVSTTMKPYSVRPLDPDTGKPLGMKPATAGQNPDGALYSSQCFYQPETVYLNNPTVAAGYHGLGYGANITNTTPGTLPTCGYSPQDVHRLYGLDTVYGKGYTGKGQTVAIVDAYGSPTITADLKTFSQIYSLPAPTATSFQVLEPQPVTKADAGWAGETTLDVEWTHAIAPDAKILLVAAPTNNDDDLQAAVLYVVENHLANIISNSYGQGELQADPQGVTSWDEVCELAALEGISVNFSSGDSGDDAAAEQGPVDVSSPADSPYATAIGGTSNAFSPLDGSPVQIGWGTNITRLSNKSTISNPPIVEGFLFGAGGGTSQYFKLPSYQAALGGTGRQLPDVSALADPYTGAEIIITVGGAQYFEVYGGTSLASPIFSAEWALADQIFGFPLGQAAPYIARYANTPAVTDVVPPPTQFNVYGAIFANGAIKSFTADDLIAPENSSPFLSAIYHGTSTSYYDLSFGSDSSLPVTTGWDPVTGWGSFNLPGVLTLLGK